MNYYRLLIGIILIILGSAVALAEANTLNIYSWGNYIPHEIILQFTKETGVKVNLSEYDNNETMFVKLKTTQTPNYDLVLPSSYYIERMAKHGMLQPLDKKRLTNLANINPLLLKQKFDPNNNYSIPYLWGTTGIIVNTKFSNPQTVTKWQDLWQPKYKRRLLLLNDMRDVFNIALLVLGYPSNDTNPAHIKQAYHQLTQLLPNIKLFNIEATPNIYTDEDALIGMGWSGDCLQAQKENPNLKYIYPQEGFVIWIDNFAIVKNAPHLNNAYKFINFMLRPDIAKQVSLTLGYTTANQAAIKLMPLTLQQNPIFNPPPAIMQRGSIQIDIPETILRLYEKYWEKLKLGG